MIDMLRCNEYIFAESLEQAYELNQKKNNKIIAGNAWVKMGSKQWGKAIDLSRLGLDRIEETEEEFIIGAMTPLREIEKHAGLNDYTSGAIYESVRHIVGTQFRNTVTVGGSIYGRFGFSDVLTIFLALDSYVELYKGGIIPLKEYALMPYDRDILVNLRVKRTALRVAYDSFRNQSTDFPVLTCATSLAGDRLRVAIGARPSKARLVEVEYDRDRLDQVIDSFNFGTNMRASAEYRKHLAMVLLTRTIDKITDDIRE
jgi:CO/xanthine dehydrogenase FAD-binding subunit